MGDNVVDKITIEVEASAKSTNKVFENLEKNLSSLQSAIAGLSNASKLDAITSKLDKISSSIENMTSKTKKVNDVKVAPQIDTSSVSKSEKYIENTITKINRSLDSVTSLGDKASLGDTSAFTSFERKMVSIQGDINAVKGALEELGVTEIQTSEFKALQTQIDTTKSKLDELLTKREEMESEGVDINSEEWTALQNEIDTTRTKYDELIAKESEMQSSGTATVGVDSIQSQYDSLYSSVSNAYDKMSQTPAISFSQVTSELKSVASSAWNASKKLATMVGSSIKSGVTSLISKFKNLKNTLSGIGNTTSGKVATGFKTILKYAFGIRSLYVLFRRLRTAIKDSFTELENSGAFYQTTKSNIDALKTSLTNLKYQFGAAFEPIFNYVAPALQTLINYLVTVMNTISAFIAKLTGQSTYSKAVASTAAIASNTGSAADSASEMAKQLQGFDELNNLSGESGGSSGGSSGSSDSSDVTYVTESVENALTSFWDSLADAISEGDWYKVGTIISDALTDAMENIPWDDIFEAAADFGTNFADFLNGLITDDLFYQLGRTIANAIKTALIAVISFGNEFEWGDLGSAIASGINGFVEQNPLDLAVDAFNVWANGILDTLIVAIQNVEWGTIADHIADAISKVQAAEIMGKLATLVNTIVDAIYELVSNKDSWTNLGTKVAEGINSFFTTTNWKKLGETIKETFKGIITALKTALDGVEWKEVGQAIADFIEGINWSELTWEFGSLLIAVKNAVKDILKGAKIDAGDIIFAIENVGILIASITAVKLAAEITKKVIMSMIETKILTMLGANSAAATGGAGAAAAAGSALGTVATVACELALIVAVAVAGWKIGGKLYESGTGYKGAAQGFGDTVEDLWDGLISENRVEINISELFTFTIDDINSGSGWFKNTGIMTSLTSLRDSIKSAWNKLTGTETNTKGYNGAPSDAVAYITKTGQDSSYTSSYWSELGSNILEGIASGFKLAVMSNPMNVGINLFYTKVRDYFKEKFKINSPAKAMYDLGESIFEGIIQGFINAMNIYTWAQLAQDLYNHFNGEVKTGLTAQSDFSSDSAVSKTHSKTGGNSNKVSVEYNTKLTGDAKSKTDLNNLADSFNNLSDAASKGGSASYDAKTGGQLNSISDVDTWKSKFRNLYNQWVGKTVSMGVSAGGQFSSIDDVYEWANKIDYLNKNWTGTDTSFDVNSNISDADGSGGYLERLNALKEEWKKGSASAEFKTSLTGSVTTAGGIDTLANSFKTLSTNYPSGEHSSSWSTSISGKSASEISTYANAVKSLYDKFYTGSHTASYTVSLSGNYSGVDALVDNIMNKINKKMGNYKIKVDKIAASGGAYYGGAWHNIPQYAGGTLNAGTIFAAGEAGPEIVGHINGRTEVLNKSQIAATVKTAILSGMARFRNMELAAPPNYRYSSSVYSGYNGGSGSSENSDLIKEQNMLLRQQNELLQTIASKDNSISVKEVFNATRSEANNYYNRTGNSPFLF